MIKKLLSLYILIHSFCLITAQNNTRLSGSERIYLHTDRNVYMTGDNLFYNLFLQSSQGHESKYAYFVLRDRYNTQIIHAQLEINNKVAYGSFYLPDTLNSGIYQIVCYTNCMRNEAETSFFNKEILIANRFNEDLNLFPDSSLKDTPDTNSNELIPNKNVKENIIIQLDKNEFKTREKIIFSIETDSIPGYSEIQASLSISEIIPEIPIEQSITEYFSYKNSEKNIGGSYKNPCQFYPEINGTVLQGRVEQNTIAGNNKEFGKKDNDNKKGNIIVLVSSPDTIANLQYTKTDSLGGFGLILNKYYDGKELIIRLKDNINAFIITDNKFSLKLNFTPSNYFNVTGINDWLTRYRKINLVQKSYGGPVKLLTVKEFHSEISCPGMYYKNCTTIFPGEYIELEDFIEISREIIPGLRIRKDQNKFVSGFLTIQNPIYRNDEPAIFLDGVPIDNINQIINLGSKDIEKIESLPVIRFYGDISFPGILSVFSKHLAINNIQFQSPAVKFQTLSSLPYTKPVPYNQGNTARRSADLRQTLLWEPGIILRNNKKISFECYASDLPGKFRISIQGITADGIPFYGSAVINVNNKSSEPNEN